MRALNPLEGPLPGDYRLHDGAPVRTAHRGFPLLFWWVGVGYGPGDGVEG